MPTRIFRMTLATTLAVLLGACSAGPPNGAVAHHDPAVSLTPTPSPTPSPSPSPTPVTPLVPIPGAAELGLTEPTLSVELTDPWVLDVAGYTYTEPTPWRAGAVDVVRVSFSGEELWRRSVERPDATSTPQLSTDQGLGLVAVWFTSDTDEREYLDARSIVVGDIAWFHRDTGERGGVLKTSELEGGVAKANNIALGYTFHEMVDDVVAEDATRTIYLGQDLSIQEFPHEPGTKPFNTWNGRLLVRLDKPEPGALATLGQYLLVNFEDGAGYGFFATNHFLHITSTLGDVIALTHDGWPIQVQAACAVSEQPQIATSKDQVASGALLVTVATGEHHCVEDLPEGHRISALGPGGWLLSEPAAAEGDDGSREVWIGGPEGQEWRRTGLAESPLFTDEHVVFSQWEGDSLIVTAYAASDFTPEP